MCCELLLSRELLLSELRAGAVDLDDLADLGDVDELVDQALAVHLGQNASLIIVPGKILGFRCILSLKLI